MLEGDLPPPSDPEANPWVAQRQAKYWTPQEIEKAEKGEQVSDVDSLSTMASYICASPSPGITCSGPKHGS